jgi:5-methylcytosine-specific restriction endonuclease McrA
MNDNNKENTIKGSLLFYILRDSLPHLERYSYEEFDREEPLLIRSLRDFLERNSIDEVILEKEKIEEEHVRICILNSLAREFKDIVRKEYPQLFRSHVSSRLRNEILNRDNYRCQYCGADLRELEEKGFPPHVDHLKSRRSGGKDTPDNLVSSCWKCNLGKKDFDLFEYEDDIDEEN